MFNYDIVKKRSQLEQIVVLQSQNLPNAISKQESDEQGFLTCQHDIDLLSKMNIPFPHIIALDQDKVIGYCLVMLRGMRNEIDILKPMYDQIDQQCLFNKNLSDINYFVMGQICIDKKYRGQGVFYALYNRMKESMSDSFELIITEVSAFNKRSLRAHAKQGFKHLLSYNSPDGHPWELIYWDWS